MGSPTWILLSNIEGYFVEDVFQLVNSDHSAFVLFTNYLSASHYLLHNKHGYTLCTLSYCSTDCDATISN